MALFDDPTFMVYTKGYHPKQLCLGHLVLGDWYHLPVEQRSRRIPFPLMNDVEAENQILSSDWSGHIIAKKGGKLGVDIEAFEMSHLNPSIDWSGSKVLEAEKGRRIELADPQDFLETRILTSPEINARLQMWLSIARTDYMFHKFLHRKPKIWMLTALYVLEGVKSHTISEKSPSLAVGVNSALVGALSGIPLGASVEVAQNRGTETGSFRQEPQVYAARWQLLQAEYLKEGALRPPAAIALHKDNIYSSGYAMGAKDEEENEAHHADTAALRCVRQESGKNVFGDEGTLDVAYWEDFDKVQKRMSRRLEGA